MAHICKIPNFPGGACPQTTLDDYWLFSLKPEPPHFCRAFSALEPMHLALFQESDQDLMTLLFLVGAGLADPAAAGPMFEPTIMIDLKLYSHS